MTDMSSESRWPPFCEHAAERGVRSSMLRDAGLGALNLYAFRRDAFEATDRETGAMFAAQAAVAISNAQTYAASVKVAEELRQAIDSRSVIDQAIGILIGQHGYGQGAAFDELRTASQQQNRK